MPKQRNSSAAKKRFVTLKSGKIKRWRQNKRHLLNGKETARKRNARRTIYVSTAQDKTIKTLVGKQG